MTTVSFLEKGCLLLLVATVMSLATFGGAPGAYAQEDSPGATEEVVAEEAVVEEADLGVGYALDNAFLFIAAILVFFMQAGFAMVEAGFNSSKNAVNILFKNSMDICVGILLFFLVGFGLMYPTLYMGDWENVSGYFAFGGSGLSGYESAADRTFSPEVDWLFQAVFAATAATIVSGAVFRRTSRKCTQSNCRPTRRTQRGPRGW
jgi:Amt family ammonium transporter